MTVASETKIETDYLVVGAGASGMAFVDALVSEADVDVVLVDRRDAPGGHWVDAYPFVRLHQPSTYYGVNSLPLGEDRIDTHGINAGFYERATAAEIRHYYERALDQLSSSGRVRFLGNMEYRGREADQHIVTSTLTGQSTTIRPRRRFVDATYVESIIPATHEPDYAVAEGARVVTPNALVRLDEPASDFVLIGGGKTSMDAAFWLLEQGVDPDRIRWVRPRDGWFVDRRYTQPMEQAASMAEFQARTIEACASAASGLEYARQLEAQGFMCRLDLSVDPLIYRGATVARAELAALTQIERVVRRGRVRSVGTREIELDGGAIPTSPESVHIDCSAQGLATGELRPIFSGDTITVQFTTLGVAPWSAAILGFVESLAIDDEERNRLCPPVPRTGLIADQLWVNQVGFHAEGARRASAELVEWSARARLNPGRTVADHMDAPEVQASMAIMGQYLMPALENLAKYAKAPSVAANSG